MQHSSGMELDVVPVTPIRQNCTLLHNMHNNSVLIVDPGGDVEKLVQKLQQKELQLDMILLTHGHFDHAGGATELKHLMDMKQKQPVEIVGPSHEDAFLLASIEQQAHFFGMDSENMRNVISDRYLNDGEMIFWGGREIKVLHVPGHTPGHVVFFDKTNNTLLAGDTLFAGTIGRTDLEYGNHTQLVEAIKEKILPLGDEVVVLPGHGRLTRIGIEKATNPYISG